jgi:hypothetical protein
MKLLISIENLKEFRPLSSDIPEERLVPYMQEAQQLDLKRLLGDVLFVDFLAKFDVSADPKYNDYQDLLKGKTYSYGGQTYQHPGLIGYLSYMTLARYYNNAQINPTKFGLVQKNNGDQSTPLDPKTVAASVAELRSNALALQVDIIKFLSTNGTTYPLYNFQDGSALGQTGVRFFDLDDRGNAGNGRTLTSF